MQKVSLSLPVYQMILISEKLQIKFVIQLSNIGTFSVIGYKKISFLIIFASETGTWDFYMFEKIYFFIRFSLFRLNVLNAKYDCIRRRNYEILENGEF